MDEKDSTKVEIKREDLPLLYRLASDKSGKAQNRYLWLVKCYIISLIIGSALLSISINNPDYRNLRLSIIIIGSISLMISTFMVFLMTLWQPEKDWYSGRGIAESVKTMAWRYITRAEPYNIVDGKELDDMFIKELRSIWNEHRDISWELDADVKEDAQITGKMREVRGKSTRERLDIYKTQRLDGQLNWYRDHSKICQKGRNKWFLIIIISQILAFGLPYVLFVWPACPVNMTSILAVVVAAFFSWMQVKRYQELAQSYGTAAGELMLIKAESVGDSDEALSDFVGDAENAISREHTFWNARRDAIRYGNS